MKIRIWQGLVSLLSLLPPFVWMQLGRLIFAIFVRRGTRDDLRKLLTLQERLSYDIDEIAIHIEGGVHPKHRLMCYHDFFVNRVCLGEKVLDVGCGIGSVAYSIATHGGKVLGIDMDKDHLLIAQKRYKHANLRFIEGDVTKDLPDELFDVIVLSNVLEHIEDRVGLLSLLCVKFRPRKILIRVPMINRDWMVPLRRELGMNYFSDPTHFIEYSQESFAEEMESVHLNILSLQVNWGEIWAEVTPDDSR